jgi:hypothetical protein
MLFSARDSISCSLSSFELSAAAPVQYRVCVLAIVAADKRSDDLSNKLEAQCAGSALVVACSASTACSV